MLILGVGCLALILAGCSLAMPNYQVAKPLLNPSDRDSFCGLPRSCASKDICEGKNANLVGYVSKKSFDYDTNKNGITGFLVCNEPNMRYDLGGQKNCVEVYFNELLIGETEYTNPMGDHFSGIKKDLSLKILDKLSVINADYVKIKLNIDIKKHDCPVMDDCLTCPIFLLRDIDSMSVIQQ